MKLSDIIRDSRILTKRSMTHIVKNMDQLLGVVIMPVMFLLLFRYVFGGAIDTGGTTYINFLVAGILIQTLAFGASTTAISLVLDMKKGIVDRFKSLPIFAPGLLVAHTVADLVRNMLSAIVMMFVAFIVGFRPTAGLNEWIMIFALLLLFTFALSWLFAILGLLAKSFEAIQWMTFVIIMPLTFASSAFVPTEGMPGAVKWFAENQPFTQVIEAMRALMVGTPIGNYFTNSLIWCIGILIVSMPLAVFLFNRKKPN
jgi:ABC-2 type transport system permease protein